MNDDAKKGNIHKTVTILYVTIVLLITTRFYWATDIRRIMTAHQKNHWMVCVSDDFILEFNSLLVYETQNWEIVKSAYNWPQNYKHRIDDQSVDVHKARSSYTDRFFNKKYILFCSFLPVSTKYLSHYGMSYQIV